MSKEDIVPKAAEFFAGIGLVRRAMESARGGPRWGTIFANDNDPAKHRIYDIFYPDTRDVLKRCDVAELKPRDVPPCDLWTVSFPCTDVSIAGGRLGIHANQSSAVWKVVRLLRDKPSQKRPRVVLFENVMGLLSSHGGSDFYILVQAINDCGYTVDPIRVDAKHFVPQSRQRLFLVARRQSATEQTPVDLQQLLPTPYRPVQIIEAMCAHRCLKWQAKPLPSFPKRKRSLSDVLEYLEDDDPRWWSEDRVSYFRKQIHPNHTSKMKTWLQSPTVRYVTAFRRVRRLNGTDRCVAEIRSDGIAGCLRTPKGGSAKQILIRIGERRISVRHLTPFECMRLQGWDRRPPEGIRADDMLFALGDAVCVPAVQWVLKHAVAFSRSRVVPHVAASNNDRRRTKRPSLTTA